MKRFLPLLYSAYLGMIIYSILNCFYSSSGFYEYQQLKVFEKQLSRNIEELEGLNEELATELERLRTSDELVTLKARELGYIRDGEIIVKTSWNKEKKNFYSVGRLLKKNSLHKDRKPVFRTVSIMLMLTSFIFFSFLSNKSNHDHKKG